MKLFWKHILRSDIVKFLNAFRNRLIWNFLWKTHYLYLSKMKQRIWNAIQCHVKSIRFFKTFPITFFIFASEHRLVSEYFSWNESKTVSVWTQHMMTLNIAQGVKNRNIKGTSFNICCCNIILPLDTFFFVTKTYFLQHFQFSRQTNTYTLQIFFILSLLLKGIYPRIYFL